MSKYVGNILTDGAATGYSCGFNGSNKLTASANAAFALGTGDFTVEAWVYPPATQTSYAGIVEFSNTTSQTSGRPQLAFGVSNQIIWATDAATIVQTSVAISSGQWTHLAVARSSGTTRLFVNGALITSASDTTNYNQYGINIGLSYTTYFNGSISNVRIVKGTAVYTAAFTPPTQLFAITNTSLLTCQQPTIIDTSSNAFAITNTGGVTVSNFSPFPAYQAYNPASGGGTPGIWSLNDAAYAAQNQSWNMYDPYWKNTTLLLNGENAANGAQNNTFLDSSTNNFTITRNGNTTQGTFSPYGSLWSNYFDGSGDYLTLPASSSFDFGTGDFTVEGWWFINSLATAVHPITLAAASPSSGNDIAWYIYMDGSANEAAICSGNTYYAITGWSSSVTLSKWQHFAFVRQSGTIRFYLNGVQVGTASANVTINSNASWTTKVGTYTTSLRPFNGYLSNIRIVKGTCQYPSGTTFTPSTTPLTAVSGTSLLTCQSNRFIDNSSNNFAITVNGNTSVQRFSPFNPTAPYSASTIGGSGYFDGSGDYLTTSGNNIPASFDSADWTVECWVYPTSLSGTQCQLSFTAGGAKYFCALQFDSTTFYTNNALLGTSLSWRVDGVLPASFKTNQWNHIAAVRSGTNVMQFVNGARIINQSGVPTTNIIDSNVLVNSLFYNGSYFYQGQCNIAGLRIVSGTALYTDATYTVPTTPPTAVTNTRFLANFTNAGIPDAAMMNDLETVGNAQVSTSVKKYGTGSLAFDGTGDYLTAPTNPAYNFGTGDFTIEAWIYVSAAPISGNGFRVYSYQYPVSSSSVAYIGITNSGGTVYANAYLRSSNNTGGTAYTGTTGIPLNTWTHIALTRSGTTGRLFTNGVIESTQTSQSQDITISAPVYIATYEGSSEIFNGYIDDLRITKGIARYTANFTPPTSSLQNL